jgi:hypothetical protein
MSQVPGATQSITVVSGTYSVVIAQSYSRQITVGEDPGVVGYPTSDFYVAKPAIGQTPRRVQTGGTYTFVGPFIAGTVAGFITTVSGTTTFFQDEQ